MLKRSASRRLSLAALAAGTAFAALPAGALAQAWPSKPIRLVVGFAPGGGTDIIARAMAPRLSELLGAQVVVENRAGASGAIGADIVAKSAPDGYTLVMGHSNPNVIVPFVFKVPYDPANDFTPIHYIGYVPNILAVHPSVGVKNVDELIALVRSKPGVYSYASSGIGSSQHLAGALFTKITGTQMNHVPYKGSGQAMQDLVGGQVKVSFVGGPNAVPYLANGKLRALGVTTSKRSADLPDIPTIDEAGVAGYDATLWLGLLAPPGTPAEVVAKLREGVTKALSTPEARKLVNSAGVDVALSSPEEFAALMKAELERWGKVVRETGATVN